MDSSPFDAVTAYTPRSEEEAFESEVVLALRRMQAKEEAERRLSETRRPGGDRRLVDDLLDVEGMLSLPPPEWLIGGTLVEGSMCVLFGQPGSYKSFIALSWACSVATGRDWLGKSVRQGPALYVAAEGAPGMSKRLRSWLDHQGMAASDVRDDLHFLPRPVSLLDADTVDQLVGVVQAREVSLVVVDTLARSIPGADENSARDMGKAVGAVDMLRELGCAVVLVHHTPKDPGNATMRGSSALNGATDTGWRTDKESPLVTLTNVKQKDAEEVSPLTLVMREVGESVVPAVPTVAEHAAVMSGGLDTVSAIVSANPGVTQTELAKQSGMKLGTLRYKLDQWSNQGLLRVETRGRSKLIYPVAADD
jgi:hypothetical protein